MSRPYLRPAEPDTGQVSYKLLINGKKIPRGIQIHSIVVQTEVNRIPSAFIRITDGEGKDDGSAGSAAYFIPGNEIEIIVLYLGIDESIFKGIVTRHSLRVRQAQRELYVECRDRSLLMTVSRNSRLFTHVRDSDIASTLLANYGLSGAIEDTTVSHAEITQYDCSDWDFLISRMESAGFVTITHNGKVDIVKPGIESAASVTLRYGSNVIDFDGDIEGSGQYGRVIARSWNPSDQELLESEAGAPSWKTTGDLDPAFISTTAGAPEYVLRQPGKLSEQESQQWTDARLLRSRMAFICGRARVKGFTKASPGITVAIEGFGSHFDGLAWVSGIRYEMSKGTWLTDLQLGMSDVQHTGKFMQSPVAGNMLPGINGLHTAIVTSLESDPGSEPRIKIRIPSVDSGGDGTWARMATPDAGSNRGSVFLPEINDEVLIGFLNDDPRQPVVIGSLYSRANTPPPEASGNNPKKGFITRSGMRILFDDEKCVFTLDTRDGNSIILDKSQQSITIRDQNGNKIALSSDGILVESSSDLTLKALGNIRMESSMELQGKAGTQCKLNGSGGLELVSGGKTILKGNIVEIN